MTNKKRLLPVLLAAMLCLMLAGCIGDSGAEKFSGVWEGSVSFPGKGDYAGVEFTVPASLELALEKRGGGSGSVTIERRGTFSSEAELSDRTLTLSSPGDYSFTGNLAEKNGTWVLEGNFSVHTDSGTDVWEASFYPEGTGHKLGAVGYTGTLPQIAAQTPMADDLNGYWSGSSTVIAVTAVDPSDQQEADDSWQDLFEDCYMEVLLDEDGVGVVYIEQEDSSYYEMETELNTRQGTMIGVEDLEESYSYLYLMVENRDGEYVAVGYLTLQTGYAEFYMELELFKE